MNSRNKFYYPIALQHGHEEDTLVKFPYATDFPKELAGFVHKEAYEAGVAAINAALMEGTGNADFSHDRKELQRASIDVSDGRRVE